MYVLVCVKDDSVWWSWYLLFCILFKELLCTQRICLLKFASTCSYPYFFNEKQTWYLLHFEKHIQDNNLAPHYAHNYNNKWKENKALRKINMLGGKYCYSIKTIIINFLIIFHGRTVSQLVLVSFLFERSLYWNKLSFHCLLKYFLSFYCQLFNILNEINLVVE